jgi:hypothetical protein
MHPNKGLFVEYQELKAPILVDGIAGNRSAVGAGLMRIVDDRGNVAYLENALHVPGLPSGLFSLNRALIDKNWETRITRQGILVGNDDFSILVKIDSDGLSRYNSPTPSAAVAAGQLGVDINRWHQRFAYGSKDEIQKLAAHVDGLEIAGANRVIFARYAIIDENELYRKGKDVDESASLFDKVPTVRRGRPRKEVLIAPAPAPAPAPVPPIEEEVFVEDPAPVPEISIPAPTREPTPPATDVPAREPSPEPPDVSEEWRLQLMGMV